MGKSRSPEATVFGRRTMPRAGHRWPGGQVAIRALQGTSRTQVAVSQPPAASPSSQAGETRSAWHLNPFWRGRTGHWATEASGLVCAHVRRPWAWSSSSPSSPPSSSSAWFGLVGLVGAFGLAAFVAGLAVHPRCGVARSRSQHCHARAILHPGPRCRGTLVVC